MNNYWVYMITNINNKVLYIGMTNNLERRIYEHKNKLCSGFSSRYNLNKLVYCEVTNHVEEALTRETQLKGWTRHKKNDLINSMNPNWNDLALEWGIA